MSARDTFRTRLIAAYKTIGESDKTPNDFLQAVLHVVEKKPDFDINFAFDAVDGRSLFAQAALHGRIDIMTELRAMGANMNMPTPLFVTRPGRNGLIPTTHGGYTPLHYAAMKGKAGAVAWLFNHGVNPFEAMGNAEIVLEENEGITPPTPLHLAMLHPKTLTVFAKAIGPERLGAELCEAVYEGSVNFVKVLSKVPGIDLNIACDEDGRTPLYNAGRIAYYAEMHKDSALREKAETMFELLLKAGAKTSIVVADEHIAPEEEAVMSIEQHALNEHFTPVCVKALVDQKRANAHKRRRHMLMTRRRPAGAGAAAKSASSSKSKSPTRRKSRNNE